MPPPRQRVVERVKGKNHAGAGVAWMPPGRRLAVMANDTPKPAGCRGGGGRAATPEQRHLDPVCGMRVDEASAAATAEHDGQTYHFCSRGCRDRFVADPPRYLEGRRPAGPVTGGTVNGRGGFVMRATRVGGDTLLSQIVRLVAEAHRRDTPPAHVEAMAAFARDSS